MKKALLIISLIFLAACGEEEDGFSCGAVSPEVSSLSLGQSISGLSAFNRAPDSTYSSDGFCRETYYFNQYNEETGGWCYYYDISVDCSTNQVDDIFTATKLFENGDEL